MRNEQIEIPYPEEVFGRSKLKAKYIAGENRNDVAFLSVERQEHLELQRGQKLQKANFLVFEGHFDFTLTEILVSCYLASILKPEMIDQDDGLITYKIEYCINVGEVLDILNKSKHGGFMYGQIKEAFKALKDKSVWIRLPNGKNAAISWLNKVLEDPVTKELHIRFDDSIVPYITALRDNYLLYNLIYILPMRSKYSVILYECLRAFYGSKMSSYHCKKTDSTESKINKIKSKNGKMITYQVERNEIKRWFCLEGKPKYKSFSNIEKLILKAVEEINQYTDITVDFKKPNISIGKGKAVNYVYFIIKEDKDPQIVQRRNNMLLSGEITSLNIENK